MLDLKETLCKYKNLTESSEEIEEKIYYFQKESLLNLVKHVQYLTHNEHRVYGEYFRLHMYPFIVQASITCRALQKPLGYAGDYEMMRMLYDNSYEGTTHLGRLIHKYFIETNSIAIAVRNRLIMIPQLIIEYINRKNISILSVACGPAYEVTDILKNSYLCKVTLLDQDKEALQAAKDRIPNNPNVSYLNINIKTLFKNPKIVGNHDFIYSMGLFDYLNDKEAKIICKCLFSALNPGGVLIIRNFSINTPKKDRYAIEYWGDWNLIYRTEEQMLSLVPNDETCTKYKLLYEDLGVQMFLCIEKSSIIKSKI